MSKYLFLIDGRLPRIDLNYLYLDLANASLNLATIYQSMKCYSDIKDDLRVDYILYTIPERYKKIKSVKFVSYSDGSHGREEEVIENTDLPEPILDSRIDSNRKDYIAIDFCGNYEGELPEGTIRLNAKSRYTFEEYLEVLKPYYKRYVEIIKWEDLFTDSYKNKRFFVKSMVSKDKNCPNFIYPDDINKPHLEWLPVWMEDQYILIQAVDPIFESGLEYRVIVVKKKIHSIQNYKDEGTWDEGGDLVRTFADKIVDNLIQSGLIKDSIFSFDIVTDGVSVKIVEFHHRTHLLGHYHKENQNNYTRYVDLILED